MSRFYGPALSNDEITSVVHQLIRRPIADMTGRRRTAEFVAGRDNAASVLYRLSVEAHELMAEVLDLRAQLAFAEAERAVYAAELNDCNARNLL